MKNKKLAEMLKDSIENGDIDAVWFVIGELEKENKFGEADYSELYLDHIKMVGSRNYKIEITFTTNQELTKGELADLESAISLQLEEPKDYDQNDVSYEIKEITYKMEEVK
jgi:hypothetical protein